MALRPMSSVPQNLREWAQYLQTADTLPQKRDIVIDDAANGLVLKDTQTPPHYWRVAVSAGTLVITDIGTSLP